MISANHLAGAKMEYKPNQSARNLNSSYTPNKTQTDKTKSNETT